MHTKNNDLPDNRRVRAKLASIRNDGLGGGFSSYFLTYIVYSIPIHYPWSRRVTILFCDPGRMPVAQTAQTSYTRYYQHQL